VGQRGDRSKHQKAFGTGLEIHPVPKGFSFPARWGPKAPGARRPGTLGFQRVPGGSATVT